MPSTWIKIDFKLSRGLLACVYLKGLAVECEHTLEDFESYPAGVAYCFVNSANLNYISIKKWNKYMLKNSFLYEANIPHLG